MDWLLDQDVQFAYFGMAVVLGYAPEYFNYQYNMQEKSASGQWINHHYACNNQGCLVFDPSKGGSWTQHFFQFGIQMVGNIDIYVSKRCFFTLRAITELSYNWQVGETITGDTDNWYQKKDDFYDYSNAFNIELFLRYKI